MAGVLRLASRRRSVGPAIFAVVVALFFAVEVGAETIPDDAEWIVDAWQTDAGLPNNSVTSLLQSRDHYLWVGTSNGLARFDGVRFTTFRSLDNPGLPSNRILCLYEDARGVLWIGTEDEGLARYDHGKFKALTIADGLPADTVLCAGEDRAGQLWVGTSSGLVRARTGGTGLFFTTESLPGTPVFAVTQAPGLTMLFATPRGLYRFRQDRVIAYQDQGAPPDLTNGVLCVAPDKTDGLWLGGELGLVWLPKPDGGHSVDPRQVLSGKIMALSESTGAGIWAGTSAGELYRVASAGITAAPKLVWHFPSAVTALREDQEGNLWVGTAANGLHRLKQRQLRWIPFSESLGDAPVSASFDTADGEVWLVAADKRLYRCENGHVTLARRLPMPDGVAVQTACKTPAGEIWLGTLRDGLFALKGETLRQWGERDGLSDSAIGVVCADNAGGIWVGTRNGGLNYLKEGKVTRFNAPWGFGGNFACALALDFQGGLWIGTTGDGLFHFAGGRFGRYTEAEGLTSSYVRTLHADPDGTVWIGTSTGLCRAKAGRVTALTARNGLSSEAILQLRSDTEGNLWVGSSSAIFRLRKEQLHAYAEGRLQFLDAVPYGKEDGLPGVLCVAQMQSKGAPDGDGPIWFWTNKGIVARDSRRPPSNTLPPEVLLESVLVENESVPFADLVRISPGRENLQFHYTALSLTAPGKVCFRYQLEAFDRDWSEVTLSRVARYPKVPPGTYRFRVMARNNDGVWNTTGASVGLVVAPFWWATTWFRLATVAAVTGLLAGLYRLRQVRQQELERLRVRIASDLHDDIGSSLWSITLLSRMLARHGSLGAEEKDDVNEIHRIAVQASNSIRDIIWLINPAFNTLQDLVLRLKDFAGTALRGSAFSLECDAADLAKKLPLDFRQHLFFFFKEALTNIAKHAQARTVEVRLAASAGRWRFSIRDDGVGFDPAAATSGNGLKSLRARAAKMGATCEIQSRTGQGTNVVLITSQP
jgi:ligand-binding sensor domain-containing protein/signal transduction histidine kinase